MTNEEIWRCTDLRRYIPSTIPQTVFDEYRRELAEMAAFLRQEEHAFKNAAQATSTPQDINAMPENIEYEATVADLVEQGILGLECADGQEVCFEISREEFNKLNLENFNICQPFGLENLDTKLIPGRETLYLMTPAGIITLKVVDENPE